MDLPKDLFYTENHEWLAVDGDEATIGITEYAQEEMGDVVFVELPEVGEEFEQFDSFGVVESVKAVADVYIPVGGKVIAINEELFDQPELINEEPYDGGWLIKIKITDEDELESLMNHEEYERFLEEVD
ncbi:MAG: glycine cleavage system protein GcvH [Halanaerobiaceae bacterium]|jgi:glycine cleavage system H protein|nr:glycine cleavage system protein GcvH [Halanaerobiaceae bacterium]